MALEDKTLSCVECSREFTFTAGEQEFYLSRGLVNEPRRCPECRATRRQERSRGYGDRMFPVVCAECGQDTEVPFEPREGRPVYCSDCYAKMKSNQ